MSALDETDLQLINVVQSVPRASWVEVAAILGISASAVAARWRRISDAGQAWVTLFSAGDPSCFVTVLMWVHLQPEYFREHLQRLCRDARVVGVDEISDAGQLLLTVQLPTVDALRDLANAEFASIPGLRVLAVRVVTDVIRWGSQWRLDALDAEQVAQLRALPIRAPIRVSPASVGLDATQRVIEALALDGRGSVASIARRVDGHPSTVRRTVNDVLASPNLRLRCDVANEDVGWPLTSIWLGRVPTSMFQHAVAVVKSLGETRVCFVVTGDAELIFSTYHRRLDEVTDLRAKLARLAPALEIMTSSILLHSHKRSGWLLTNRGRRSGDYVRPDALNAEHVAMQRASLSASVLST